MTTGKIFLSGGGGPQKHDSKLICIPDGIGVIVQDGKIVGDVGKSYTVYEQ